MATKIENLRLEPADNGFSVCWNECAKNESNGAFGNSSYIPHSEVFRDDESKQAMKRFMELRDKMKGIETDTDEVKDSDDY